jgi:hypothetical protein
LAEYLLLSVEREHESLWLATTAGVSEFAEWLRRNDMPAPHLIASGTIGVWLTDDGLVVRYRAFVLDRPNGRYARGPQANLPLLQDGEQPYLTPLPEGVGRRHDELPFPPPPSEAGECEGQLTL